MSGFYVRKKTTKKDKTTLSEVEGAKILKSHEKFSKKTKNLKITGFDGDFYGVANYAGNVYHVKNAIAGETVEIEIGGKNKERGASVITVAKSVVTPSEFRVDPPCKYYGDCGNCNLLHLSYPVELKLKTDKIGKIAQKYKTYAEKTQYYNEYAYRNKVHLAFSKISGKITLGFFNEETHGVVSVDKCLLHGAWFVTLIKTLEAWANDNNLSAYAPWQKFGLLRFAAARYMDGELMLTIVSTEKLRNAQKLLAALKKEFKKVVLYGNVNVKKTSEIFSDNFYFIGGDDYKLSGEMLGVKYRLGPDSFFQVNKPVAEAIYKRAAEELGGDDIETVIDAFSGIGITTALFAKNGKKVISVEIVKKAVEDAREIMALNGVADSAHLIAGDFTKVLPKLKIGDNAGLFIDPPRKGLNKSVIDTILKFRPVKIVYLSCDPESLSRDLSGITKGGYALNTVAPYNMFPKTKHVETLCVLTRI